MKPLFNINSFIKFLSRNKTYTLIDLFGLSVSLMFVLLIAVYTTQELSTDQQHTKGDRIYLVGTERFMGTGASIPYRIKERYPEVEAVCPVVTDQATNTIVQNKDRRLKSRIMFADSTFFHLFDFRLVEGDRSHALESTNYALISQSYARKMFGQENPIGQELTIDTLNVIVNGVIEDFRNTSFPETDIIMRWEQVAKFNDSLAPDQIGNAGSTICFVLTREGSDFPARKADMLAWFNEFYWIYIHHVEKEVKLVRFSDYYFNRDGGGRLEYSSLRQGDWNFVVVLMSVGILILLFAVTNYINLTVAQAGFRAKEMATRRLLGSSRGDLFARLMLESTLLTFVALGIGILLATLVAPYANDLLQTHIYLSTLLTPAWIVALLLLTVAVGCVAGLLPATVISAAKPIEVVRGTFRRKTKMVFSRVFIIFQNVITITMIGCSIVMVAQLYHMMKAPLGYNTHNLLCISNTDEKRLDAFLSEARSLSCVKRVGVTQGLPLFGSNNWTTTYEGRTISFQQFIMDKNCYEMLGLKIARDNHLTTYGYYLNRQALREMNLSEDAKSFTLNNNDSFSLCGVIEDFHFGNITTLAGPVLFRFIEKDEDPWMILVETQGDPYEARRELWQAYERVTGIEPEGSFMDEELEKSFESQIRLAKIVVVFSIIAIVISLLGLLAMSTYFIQQRAREIAVRKVFGSTDRQVLTRLVSSFLLYVGIAFVIAVPLILYFMRDWLASYSYRIALSPWIFIAAGLFCLLISFVTVFFQSYRAANENPSSVFRSND